MLLTMVVAAALGAGEPAPPEGDLAARLELASVPGVTFRLAGGEKLPPAAVCAGPKARCDAPERRYDINWDSAPERVTPIRVPPAAAEGARVLLATENGDPLLLAKGNIVVIAVEPTGDLRRWPYFNYLLHAAAADAAGTPVESYAEWPGSPMPQAKTRWTAAITLVALWVGVVAFFRRARRRGAASPDAAARFFRSVAAAAAKRVGDEAGAAGPGPAGAGGALGASSKAAAEGGPFTRTVSGYLSLVGSMTFIAGIYLFVQWVMSAHVQPFPEADGLWRTTFEALWVIWGLFDAGTEIAFPKYFAEHRVNHPARALADAQFYIWWQIFARLFQVTALAAIGLGWAPFTPYAIYAPFVSLYAAIALPALMRFGKVMSGSLGRFDYQSLLDVGEQRVFKFVVPIPFALLGRYWGRNDVVYGEAFGAAVGLGVGQMMTYIVMVVLGLGAVKRAGAPLGPLFLAQFDKAIAFRQLLFGVKVTIGADAVNLIKTAEAVIVVALLRDFTAWQGIRDLLNIRINGIFEFPLHFFYGGIPLISAAYSAGKRVLTQYYVARFFQLGFIFQMTMFSVMLAVGPSFITALGPQWSRALPYLPLALCYGLTLTPAWVSDPLQLGTGRASAYVISLGAEQACRFALFFILVPRLQFGGIILATVGALALKAVIAWALNHRMILPFRVDPWASIGAPAIAAAANYALWWAIVRLLTPAGRTLDTTITLVLLCVALGASFFLCFFVCGLVGGFDTVMLSELRAGAGMTTIAGPIARALARIAEAGARLGGVKRRGLAYVAEAQAEHDALEEEARLALERGESTTAPVAAHH